jgi:hypothetical protein
MEKAAAENGVKEADETAGPSVTGQPAIYRRSSVMSVPLITPSALTSALRSLIETGQPATKRRSIVTSVPFMLPSLFTSP